MILSPQLPLSLSLRDRLCLVVGDSSEAVQRVRSLLERQARVRWLTSKAFEGELPLELSTRLQVRLVQFEASQLDGVWLSILADRDEQLARLMFDACEARPCLFCAIDQPPYYNFSHMALVESGPVVIAIGTGGRAPALARRLQTELRKLFTPARVVAFFEHIANLREQTPAPLRRATLEGALAEFRIQGDLALPGSPGEPDYSKAGNDVEGSGAG